MVRCSVELTYNSNGGTTMSYKIEAFKNSATFTAKPVKRPLGFRFTGLVWKTAVTVKFHNDLYAPLSCAAEGDYIKAGSHFSYLAEGYFKRKKDCVAYIEELTEEWGA